MRGMSVYMCAESAKKSGRHCLYQIYASRIEKFEEYASMADDKESPVHNMEENTLGNPPVGQVGSSAAASGADSVPMQMKLLSTWEVRKMPPNCVCRYSNNLAKKGNIGWA